MDNFTSYFSGPQVPTSLLRQAASNSKSPILKPLLGVEVSKTAGSSTAGSSLIGRFEGRDVNQVVGSSSSYQPPAVSSEALSVTVRSEVPLHREQVSIAMPSASIAEASEHIESIPTTVPELSLVDKNDTAIRTATEQAQLMNLRAIKADEDGKPNLALSYRAVAAKQEEAAALQMQSLQAEAQGKANQAIDLSNAGYSTRMSAGAQFKAIEAEESEKTELGLRYRAVATKYEEALALHMQGLEANAQGKVNQGDLLNAAGYYTSLNAEAQFKTIEAEESGKTELGLRYRAVAAKQEEAAALPMQALQAWARGKATQVGYLNKARFSTSSSAKAQLKAIDAEESGKPELGSRYRAVAAKYEEASALHMQALQAEAQEKANQALYLNNAGFDAGRSAEAQLKAIEAEESGKPELGSRYRAVAAKYEEALALHMQGLQAEAQKEFQKASCFSIARTALQSHADARIKAVEALENGSAELARRYEAVAKIYQEAATLAHSASLLEHGFSLF